MGTQTESQYLHTYSACEVIYDRQAFLSTYSSSDIVENFWDTQYNYGHIVCQAQRAEKCQD